MGKEYFLLRLVPVDRGFCVFRPALNYCILSEVVLRLWGRECIWFLCALGMYWEGVVGVWQPCPGKHGPFL